MFLLDAAVDLGVVYVHSEMPVYGSRSACLGEAFLPEENGGINGRILGRKTIACEVEAGNFLGLRHPIADEVGAHQTRGPSWRRS